MEIPHARQTYLENLLFFPLFTDKQVSPKSGTLKSPPKGFDTSAISKTYYNLVSTHSNLSWYLKCVKVF